MRQHLRFSALSLALAAGCGSSGAPTGPNAYDFGTLNGAKVELTEEGGIAALYMQRAATHDDRSFVYVRRQICTGTCGAPADSVAGAMSAAASDSLFSLIWAEAPMSLKNDYGVTQNGADMMSYTLRMTYGGATKVVHADDGTMPPAMRRIVGAVRGIVDASRQ